MSSKLHLRNRSASKAEKSTPLDSETLKAFLERATELHGAGRFDEAARLYQHVRERNPEALAAPYFHALMDVEFGYLDHALERLRYVVRGDPGSFEAQYSLAYVFEQLGHWQQAADGFRRALGIRPQSTAARVQLAGTLEVLGRLGEAVALFRELVDDERTRLRALIQICNVQPSGLTLAEQEEIVAAASDPDVEFGLRVGACFAAGDVLERQDRWDEAFVAFATGNRLRRENLEKPVEEDPKPNIEPPSARIRTEHPDKIAENHLAVVARNRRQLTPELLERHAGQGHDSAAPIFIVGMPRSGSTLLEQILSSHAKIHGLGECDALFGAVQGRYPYQPHPPGAETDPDHFRRIAEDYLARLRRLGWAKTPFVIDKMLGNYMHVGMIHLILPQAVILHSVRDPVDTCLGCFRKLFRTGNETTYDLRDIGAQYVRYREMMAHWDEVLPGRVVPVVHEELVADPESKIRWLIEEVCKLKWDDACLRFHKTRRPVRTASIAQVRQPIFTSALQRWRRYERHLGPLMEALGPYAPALQRGS